MCAFKIFKEMTVLKTQKVINMTEGRVFHLLIRFAFPIMLSGILQQFYGAVDSAVVGKFSGPEALGAIGATSSLTNLILALFIGISTGSSIVVAQFIGAEDDKSVSTAVHTAFACSIAGGLFLMFFGGVFSGQILKLMSVPEDILPLAKTYMTIYFLGSVPSLVYNFGAGILRASGDSKRPLYYLVVATVINITFNLIFVIVFHMGVKGVAISTIMSQTVTAILVVVRLTKTDGIIKLCIKKIRFHKMMFMKIVSIGIPAGIQSSLFSFSNTIIQSTINTFGGAAVAGCAASSQIENFVYMVMNAVSAASTTFISQNYGAGKFGRCANGMKKSFVFVTFVGLTLGVSLYVFKEPLLGLFTSDAEAITLGSQRLVVFAFSYFLCGIMEIVSGCLRGYGDSLSPMLICLVGITGSRLFWIFTILPFNRVISMVYAAFPISWIITTLALSVRYFIYKKNIKERYEKTFLSNKY